MNNEIVASLCFEKIVMGNITLSFKGLTQCDAVYSLRVIVYTIQIGYETT